MLLVAGYAQPPGVMTPLRRALERSGRRVIPVDLPSQGAGDIDVSARYLAGVVEDSRAPRVDLVGFSAGAIVVRAFEVRFDTEGRARRIVLLGAPNHGARIADTVASRNPELCFGACAELRRGSGYLERLDAETKDSRASYTSVWTATDVFVQPPRSAVLEGAVNVRLQDVCPGSTVSHGELVSDDLPVALTLESLDGLYRPPRPQDCERLRRSGARALG